MALITCPECESVFTEQQLKDAGMCPSCGLPESEIRKHTPPPAAEPNTSRPAVKINEDAYKTTASKMLAAFAWLIWSCGIIGVIAIAATARSLRYSYYASIEAGTELFFIAVAVAFSSLFFGALLYGASKLLVDIHATRLNLEKLNAKKED